MTTETTHSRPTHRVYAVRKARGDKAHWTEIGAAWPHRDGKGFNLQLDLIPITAAEIVVRASTGAPRITPTIG